MTPRRSGLPRPVTSPSSDKSLRQAHADAGADRGGQAHKERAVRAVGQSGGGEQRGASVETEPSIRPSKAGWTFWRTNCASVSGAESASVGCLACSTAMSQKFLFYHECFWEQFSL